MNKAEIEKQIDRVNKIIDKLEPWLAEAITMKAELLSSLEAEKPKLRHGDFGEIKWPGTDSIDHFAIMEQATLPGSPKAFFADQGGQQKADSCMPDAIIFGNIFDLLKEWSEDLGDIYIHGIRLERSGVEDIFICADNKHLALTEAEDFWRKLGQKIATLKRKQCSHKK